MKTSRQDQENIPQITHYVKGGSIFGGVMKSCAGHMPRVDNQRWFERSMSAGKLLSLLQEHISRVTHIVKRSSMYGDDVTRSLLENIPSLTHCFTGRSTIARGEGSHSFAGRKLTQGKSGGIRSG